MPASGKQSKMSPPPKSTPKDQPKKRPLPLYIPKILADVMWASTNNGTTTRFGMGHQCHKHGCVFDIEHVQSCSEIQGCPDIGKYARMLKYESNIRLWEEHDLLEAVKQYTQLALQLANLTAQRRASLVKLPERKKPGPTGNPRGRPSAKAVVARTNHKVDEFFKPKPPSSSNQNQNQPRGPLRPPT